MDFTKVHAYQQFHECSSSWSLSLNVTSLIDFHRFRDKTHQFHLSSESSSMYTNVVTFSSTQCISSNFLSIINFATFHIFDHFSITSPISSMLSEALHFIHVHQHVPVPSASPVFSNFPKLITVHHSHRFHHVSFMPQTYLADFDEIGDMHDNRLNIWKVMKPMQLMNTVGIDNCWTWWTWSNDWNEGTWWT